MAEYGRKLEQLGRISTNGAKCWRSFYYPHEKYKSKTIREVKGSGLEGEVLSENKQLLEDVIERFGESECRTKADNPKRQSYIENEKKSSRNEKTMGRFGETRKRKEQD